MAFSTKSLRLLCENQHRAKKILGESKAEKLKHRLADLNSVATAVELVAGNPRESATNPSGMALDLCDGASMTFEANHRTPPLKENGGINWAKVSRIKIVEILS